ncbi:MAG: 23S rRNA (pseudouridine(1915)-N(3))-methyltransferase RlmH [Vampirovibrionales bacterium]|nr:23S rRNA (pseudouridine(1915)-N(3))-methyltransferase RlmH [Vampirovibrionales bacterium]
MSIVVLAVGKLKGSNRYLQSGIDEYVKRMSAFCPCQIVEIPEETITPTRSEEQIKVAEGTRILAQVNKYARQGNAWVVALSEAGDAFSSVELAERMFGRLVFASLKSTNQPYGGTPWMASNPIIFLIGGPLGLSDEVLSQSHTRLSLSRMTFPHPMARLFLLEQVYRAFKLSRNEPYHKA